MNDILKLVHIPPPITLHSQVHTIHDIITKLGLLPNYERL